jgi:K+-sensing histidine kinase KdpD
VAVPRSDLEAALDAVLGNVFAHTPPGTPLSMDVVATNSEVVITVSDGGPGWPEGLDAAQRGESGGSSTGLGLDIARRTAESTGGSLSTGDVATGGASVTITLPVVGGQPRAATYGPSSGGSAATDTLDPRGREDT